MICQLRGNIKRANLITLDGTDMLRVQMTFACDLDTDGSNSGFFSIIFVIKLSKELSHIPSGTSVLPRN